MTYCVAAITGEGIVFASDSRTNGGVDQISVFSKMNVFEVPGERMICLLSSGNLGTTQSVISLLHIRAKRDDGSLNPAGINDSADIIERMGVDRFACAGTEPQVRHRHCVVLEDRSAHRIGRIGLNNTRKR